MLSITCTGCSTAFYAPELPRRGAICFKCHVATVNLGYTYGKEDFHGPTVRQRQDKQMADARSAGINAEPVAPLWS
jgi:hypothetical protein